MAERVRQGRPKASSRETLAEAASELFLEQGYEATSVSDITARAGVSRSSFFNYFGSKHDVLWGGVDDRISRALVVLAGADAEQVPAVLMSITDDLQPDSLALAIANADAMGAVADLQRESRARVGVIADAVSARLRIVGIAPLRAAVLGAAYGGAVLAAIELWAVEGSGRTSLERCLRDALAYVSELPAA